MFLKNNIYYISYTLIQNIKSLLLIKKWYQFKSTRKNYLLNQLAL